MQPESRTTPIRPFDFEYLKSLAVKTNPVFEYAVMDSGNEKAMREIYELLFERKGVLLIGSIGSGKTYLMEFFAAAFGQLHNGSSYKVLQSNWIVRDCIKDIELINHYGRNSFVKDAAGLPNYKYPTTYCIDDLGMEQSAAKIYGNELSILTEILFDRHKMFTKHGLKTHATSNLSVESLKEKYADRATSRFREMFNVVTLTTPDRRK